MHLCTWSLPLITTGSAPQIYALMIGVTESAGEVESVMRF